MSEQNSILDKLIASKRMEEAVQFNPTELVSGWLKSLNQKEREILNRRFGLFGKEKETLEQIGKNFAITRERVRQIEAVAIKRLKELQDFSTQIESVQNLMTRVLGEYGGVMEENHFLDKLLNYSEKNLENKKAILFMTSQLLDKLERVKPDLEVNAGWKLKNISLDILLNALREINGIIVQENRLMELQELIESFKQREFFENYKNQIVALGLKTPDEINLTEELEKILSSYLIISRKIDKNILGNWGLTDWNTIVPHRMADKIYLILKKEGKPLHFMEITRLINESNFGGKTAYPATIHNELILDPRFVLVGRGIYGLAEQGYQPGTVIEIVYKTLMESQKPLAKDEIVQTVLKQRLVKPSTIYLALTNKEKFTKDADGKYGLLKK